MSHKFRNLPSIQGLALPCVQQIELIVNATVVGSLRWYAPPTDDGILQILDLQVDEAVRRRGYGGFLLRHAYAQAATVFAAADVKPRRVWACVEQKKHVIGRAFLTKYGFQHVSTLANVFRKQDGMVYQKTFD